MLEAAVAAVSQVGPSQHVACQLPTRPSWETYQSLLGLGLSGFTFASFVKIFGPRAVGAALASDRAGTSTGLKQRLSAKDLAFQCVDAMERGPAASLLVFGKTFSSEEMVMPWTQRR